jgi:hypothetical protein
LRADLADWQRYLADGAHRSLRPALPRIARCDPSPQ